MTIKEARKVLGKKVEHLTDEELLQNMIAVDKDLEEFFKKTIEQIKKIKNQHETY